MNVHLHFLVNDDTQVNDACFEDDPWITLQQCLSVNLCELHFVADPDVLCLAGVQFQAIR